mgnify:CR=1 FL=1
MQPEHEWGVYLTEDTHYAIDIYDNALLIVALMVVFVVRYRRREGRRADVSPSHNTALELTWTGIPLILVVAIYTWTDNPDQSATTATDFVRTCWPAVPIGESGTVLAMLFQLDQSQWWSPESLREHQFAQLDLLVDQLDTVLADAVSGVTDDLEPMLNDVFAELAMSPRPAGDLSVPRFETRVTVGLTEALQAAGLTAPFSNGQLMRIADDPQLLLIASGSEVSVQISENGLWVTLPKLWWRQNWSAYTSPSQLTQPMPRPELLPSFILSKSRTCSARCGFSRSIRRYR